MKTKIALCISGEPRSSMFCYPYIYESFIDLGDEYEVDIFIHSRKNYRAVNLYNPVKYFLDMPNPPYLNEVIENLSLPKELKDNVAFFQSFSIQSSYLFNQLLMLDGIVKSFSLTQDNNKKYDLYIRCRPDFMISSRIWLGSIFNDILDKKYDMFIPSKIFERSYSDRETALKEYNDQFAIGNYESMLTYCGMIDNLSYLITKTKEFRVEYWLKTQLGEKGIKVKNEFLDLSLVRGTRIYTNKLSSLNTVDQSFLDE